MAENVISGYNSFSSFAKHMNDKEHHYSKPLFYLLIEKFGTNADLLKNKHPELSELWKTCSKSCENIHKVLNDNVPSKGDIDKVEQYAEDIRTLDYSTLLELISNISFEYSSSMPRATEDEIRAHYTSLSPEALDAKVKEAKVAETIRNELAKLRGAVHNMRKDFPDVQVSTIEEKK